MLCEPAFCTTQAQTVEVYEYQESQIYQAKTGLGITTQIDLGTTEAVLDYSTGFSTGWDITRRDNVFYLKPRNVDVDTNLLIRTANHSYIFELKVVATDWKDLESARRKGVQYKITFTYPHESATPRTPPPKALDKQDPTAGLNTNLAKDRSYHFDYDVAARRKRDKWLVPTNVYDDGNFTYIRMPDTRAMPSGGFPAVFMRARRSDTDAAVNTTVQGSTIVVHGTYPFLVIRHGNDVVGLRRNAKK
ncbi:TrbG/VirB9 family P-type conjugative transfer protein [Luteibacter sp. Sphag1AF]|uniref:TrbG/VirB9 family P-type conjugative transfer protein n=1 Tax=Luteibacter sp. Sphag1AF TaxID=2587031 RepID=UPI002103D4EF|nr:TrbG/VirB9 family P-type conjugative transfer protein [Luteibacter sp. Sphag1AF]